MMPVGSQEIYRIIQLRVKMWLYRQGSRRCAKSQGSCDFEFGPSAIVDSIIWLWLPQSAADEVKKLS